MTLLQLMKFMPTIRDLLPNNLNIHCPKPELVLESSTLSYQGPKICNSLDESEKKYLISK